MRMPIIQAIKNTFGLAENEDISLLSTRREVSIIRDLPALLELLSDERTPPKVIAQALEHVVLQIKQEDDQTDNEVEFLRQIRELVDKPLYNEEQSSSMNEAEDNSYAP